jgi:hypothetical protein
MKYVVMVLLSAVLIQAFANPYLLRTAGKKVLDKKVLLEVRKGGKTFLNNVSTGKLKRVKLGFDKLIKMPKATSGSITKKGFKRDAKLFWKKFKKKFPKTLSNKNLLRIKNGKSPVVDRTWMRHFKAHKPFNGQKIEHHHLNKGSFSIPLPKGLHRDQGNSRFFH